MKTCKKCGVEKDLSEFSKNKRKTDGLDPWCKKCSSDFNKQWRLKNSYDGRITKEKLCYVCNNTKPASEFYNDKSRIDGLANKCKKCHKEYVKEHPEVNKRYDYKMKTSEKIKSEGRVCGKCGNYKTANNFYKSYFTKDGLYSNCKVCQKKANDKWVLENIDKIKEKSENKSRIVGSEYGIQLAISMGIRNYSPSCLTRIGVVDFDGFNIFVDSVFSSLSYTPVQLKDHIESLWEPWMSWDNYGKHDKTKPTWQIDHIIPQSKLPFNSFDDPNFQKCWTLENLRPLETMENKRKSNKIIPSLLKEQDIEKYTNDIENHINIPLHKSVSD